MTKRPTENAIGAPFGPMPKLLTKWRNFETGSVSEWRMTAARCATLKNTPPKTAKYPPGTFWKNLLSRAKIAAVNPDSLNGL